MVGKKKFFRKIFFAVLDVWNDADSENRIFGPPKIFFGELRSSYIAHSKALNTLNISKKKIFLVPICFTWGVRNPPKSRNCDARVKSYERFKYLWNSIDLPPGLFDVSRWEKIIKIFFCELRTSRYAHSTRNFSQNIIDFDHFLAPMYIEGSKFA